MNLINDEKPDIVIVFGAEVNWRHAKKHHRPSADEQEAAGLA